MRRKEGIKREVREGESDEGEEGREGEKEEGKTFWGTFQLDT